MYIANYIYIQIIIKSISKNNKAKNSHQIFTTSKFEIIHQI